MNILFAEAEIGGKIKILPQSWHRFQRKCSRLLWGGDVDRHAASAVRGKLSDPEGGGTCSATRVSEYDRLRWIMQTSRRRFSKADDGSDETRKRGWGASSGTQRLA